MNKLLLIALLAIAAILSVCADDVSDRKFKIEADTDKVKVEGTSGSDRVEFEMDLKSGSSELFESEFRWRILNGSKSEDIRFEFRLYSIVEYTENGTKPGYQTGEEVQTYGDDLNSGVTNNQANWGDLAQLSDIVDGSAKIKRFQAATDDGVLTVTGRISTQDATNGGVDLSPNAMKIDIEVKDYPGKANGNYIALICRLQAKLEFHDDGVSDEHEVSFKGADSLPVAAIFGWTPTLMVDGTEVDVIASSFANEGEDSDGTTYKIVFSFPSGGSDYMWDPFTGVAYSDSAASSIEPFYHAIGNFF